MEAQSDDAYRPGDLAAVEGRWQPGGLAGGAVISCTVKDPTADKKNVLTDFPVDLRYFYLDTLPRAEPPAEGPGDWARARGLVADAGLYAYGYIMRPEAVEALPPPAFSDAAARRTLEGFRKRIKKIDLDALTSEPLRAYNKGWRITADADAAEIEVVNADFAHGLAVVQARLERLPPEESDVLFRYLDIYLITDVASGECKWAAAAVGGFVLE